MSNASYIGRLAPSPTGHLHLGNVWAFGLAWLDTRAHNGKLILRMEDIDPERARPEYADAIRKDLEELGLTWDEETKPQSRRTKFYEEAIEKLRDKNLLYPCFCSRKELRALAGAPHVGEVGVPYPGTCRNLSEERREAMEASGRSSALRLNCAAKENDPWTFADRVNGPQSKTLKACGGDFALKRSDGVFAYQLAVVVDDMNGGVTHVVRGMDILDSTPRQLYLYEVLGGKPPVYAHVPLIVDAEGNRLAKRHASLAVSALREKGVTPEKIWGMLARVSGLRETAEPARISDLLSGFELKRLENKPIVPDMACLM